MSQQYLLPCECGAETAIQTRHAGETRTCRCGRKLDIPTLREIRQLRPADEDGSQGRSGPGGWSLAHGVVFAVAVPVVLICLVVAGYAAYQKGRIDTKAPTLHDLLTKSPDPFDRIDFNRLNVAQSWDVWKRLRDIQLSGRATPLHLLNRERSKGLSRWMLWSGLGAAIGLVGVVVPLVLARDNRIKRAVSQ